MPEPLTLAVVGGAILTEGIKFLYNQAGEVLKHWRARRESATKEASGVEDARPMEVKLPAAFEGQLSKPKIHFDVVEQVDEQIQVIRRSLSDYAEEIVRVDSGDQNLLSDVDALRCLLEAVYQQRITFKGEQRPASGPLVSGKIDVKEVAGYAAAVSARKIGKGAQVIGEAKAERVEQLGRIIGVDADTIGE